MAEELETGRTYVTIGLWDDAIEALESVSPSEERDILLYRARIGKGDYDYVMEKLPSNSKGVLKILRLHASYLKAGGSEEVIQKVQSIAHSGEEIQVEMLVEIAKVLMEHGLMDETLRLVHSLESNLEGYMVKIECLIALRQIALAEKELAKMSEYQDTATETSLCTVWIMIAKGGDRLEEAADIYRDIIGRYKPSNKLVLGLAVALMSAGYYSEALEELNQVEEEDEHVLMNKIVCANHAGADASYISSLWEKMGGKPSCDLYSRDKCVEMFQEALQ